MALVKRITKHGNSAGMIFDQPIMKQMGWEVGTDVEIKIDGRRMILSRREHASDEEVGRSAERMLVRHRKSLERLGR